MLMSLMPDTVIGVAIRYIKSNNTRHKGNYKETSKIFIKSKFHRIRLKIST